MPTMCSMLWDHVVVMKTKTALVRKQVNFTNGDFELSRKKKLWGVVAF